MPRTRGWPRPPMATGKDASRRTLTPAPRHRLWWTSPSDLLAGPAVRGAELDEHARRCGACGADPRDRHRRDDHDVQRGVRGAFEAAAVRRPRPNRHAEHDAHVRTVAPGPRPVLAPRAGCRQSAGDIVRARRVVLAH